MESGCRLQWEGGLHLKSLRDFCGCRRSNNSAGSSAADRLRARAAPILKSKEKTTRNFQKYKKRKKGIYETKQEPHFIISFKRL
ncbi:hypothetical protein LJC08_00375 [Methanimicrococcus sp. OttesenSCG-928-J09]|nr:hypothetical protein [Methanimicrococcus sp. OttesenSCG-928-J09]